VMTTPTMLPPLPKSKWTKHILLQSRSSLLPHLPATELFTPEGLVERLHSDRRVIIKPALGEGGQYVCRITRLASGNQVEVRTGRTRVSPLFPDLLAALPPWVTLKPCIVQAFVDLCPYGGRATDIRTIVQRNEHGQFELTGTFVKTAPEHAFVTNVKQGGAIAATHKYIRASLRGRKRQHAAWAVIQAVSLEIGQFLGNRFSNAVYGIDLGLDRTGKVWIIEVNTQPNLGILGELDPRMKKRALDLRRYNRRAWVNGMQDAQAMSAALVTRR